MTHDPILTAIDARIAKLQELRQMAVEVLALVGPVSGETVDQAPARRARGTKQAPPAPKPARPAAKAVKGETARPTEALSEAAIRTALKQGHDTPKRMATAAKLPVWKVNRALRAMEAAGSVTKTGRQRSTRYQLA